MEEFPDVPDGLDNMECDGLLSDLDSLPDCHPNEVHPPPDHPNQEVTQPLTSESDGNTFRGMWDQEVVSPPGEDSLNTALGAFDNGFEVSQGKQT
jgi:hypothetical protein